jgi:hypothetical protein
MYSVLAVILLQTTGRTSNGSVVKFTCYCKKIRNNSVVFNLLNPTGHVIHQQFNIQQLYVLPTLYLRVLYLSENKQRLVQLISQTDWFL